MYNYSKLNFGSGNKRTLPASFTFPKPPKTKSQLAVERKQQREQRAIEAANLQEQQRKQRELREQRERRERRERKVRHFNERAVRGQQNINNAMDVNIIYENAMNKARQQVIAETNSHLLFNNDRYRTLLRNFVEEETNKQNHEKIKRKWRKKLPIAMISGGLYKRAVVRTSHPERINALNLFNNSDAFENYFEPQRSQFGKKK